MIDPDLSTIFGSPREPKTSLSPNVIGMAGKAWQLPELAEDHPLYGISLRNWLLYVPNQHLAWWNYTISLADLRPSVDGKSAQLAYPEARYELLVMALDPDSDPDPASEVGLKYLTPPNHVLQFHGLVPDDAAEFVDMVVIRIVDGSLYIDSDYRRQWRSRVGNMISLLGGQLGHTGGIDDSTDAVVRGRDDEP